VIIFKKLILLINTQLALNIIKKLVLGLCSIGIFTNCITSKNNLIPEAKVIEVSSQKYRGGQKGTPSGIKYKLYVIAPANQDVFKTIGFWINDKYAPAKAYRNTIGSNKTLYSQGDTLIVSANYVLTKQGYIFQDSSLSMVKPNGFSGKVLLLYTISDKKKYVEFNEIEELEEELRP
jgi:hypothetical protein